MIEGPVFLLLACCTQGINHKKHHEANPARRLNSSIRPVHPAAFRTGATPGKESALYICGARMPGIDTPADSGAYELYLRANELTLKRSPENMALARDLY